MNSFPFKARHRESAETLYQQRARLLGRRHGDAGALIALEQRLAVHLGILARLDGARPEIEGRDGARFVGFATALQSGRQQEIDETCAQALDQLVARTQPPAPVLDALTLYPPGGDILIRLYHRRTEARPWLFTLWHRQMAELPEGLINKAELQSRDAELPYRVLTYAAERPDFSLDLFRTYYDSLLAEAPAIRAPQRLLVPSLWGGLVRGDAEAPLALQRAIGLVDDPEIVEGLLRLLALRGERESLPLLRAYHQRAPERGLPLLALTGLAEVVPLIIDGLKSPVLAETGAAAWEWLTGVPLPKRPHLKLVGAEPGRGETPAAGGGRLKWIADAQAAQGWWRNQEAAWGTGRRILGEPHDAATLLSLAQVRAGRTAADLHGLLALQRRRPLGISPWGWTALRRRRLETLGGEGT